METESWDGLQERVQHIVRDRPGLGAQEVADRAWAAQDDGGLERSSANAVGRVLDSLSKRLLIVRDDEGGWRPGAYAPLLEWGDAPRAETPEERAKYWGGGVPGAYAPNMDADWMARWKARMPGMTKAGSRPLRVEIRKTTCITRGSSVQVLLIVHEDGEVQLSMNGTAGFTAEGFAQMTRAVQEARAAMAAWRAEHPLAVQA